MLFLPKYAIFFTVSLVISYGGILIYVQKAHNIDLSAQTKNSPYFMGFVFFLMSLTLIFVQNLSGGTGRPNMSGLFGRAGIAVITTLVGLILRQALFSYDPTDSQAEIFVQELSEDLKKSAKLYRDAQNRLFNLIEEFTAARETLYRKEESISASYTTALHKAILAYTDIVENLKTLMDKNVTEINGSFDNFKGNIIQTFANLSVTMAVAQDKMKQAVNGSLDNLIKGLESLSSKKIEEVHESYIASLKTSITLISDVQNKYSSHLAAEIDNYSKRMLESTDVIGKSSESLGKANENLLTRIEALSPAIEKMSTTIGTLNSSYDRMSDSVIRQTERFDGGLKQRLGKFEEELNAINSVMDDFLGLLNRHVHTK